MISNLFGVLFSILMAVIVLLTIKSNDNPSKLTIRGKRIVFVLALFGGFFIYQFAIHFYWTCDETGCQIAWI
jgi:hypothetical protein